MVNIISKTKNRIQSQYCMNMYLRYRDWIIFSLLISIILFLIGWSMHVSWSLTENEEYHQKLIKAQMIILDQMEQEPSISKDMVEKIRELRKLLKR